MPQLGLTNMGKQFSLTFNVKDDNTIEVESLKVKLEAPRKKPPKVPPGQDFVIILLLIFLGIWFIVTFLVPGGQKSIDYQSPNSTPTPADSEQNSTAKYTNNYEALEMSFKEY